MEFKLDLKKHCIETELKRQYNKYLSLYFKNPTKEHEKRIEILLYLLKNLDFSSLRSRYPEFSGKLDKPLYLKIEKGFITLQLEAGKKIDIGESDFSDE